MPIYFGEEFPEGTSEAEARAFLDSEATSREAVPVAEDPTSDALGLFSRQFGGDHLPGLGAGGAAMTMAPWLAPSLLGPAAGLARGAVRGGAQLSGRVARAPVIRRIPGAGAVRGMAEDVAEHVPFLRGGAAAATPTPAPRMAAPPAAPDLSGWARIRNLPPLRANASASARQAHRLELEQGFAEAKVPAAQQRRLLEQFGHVEPKVAGSIKPGPAGKPVAEPAPPPRMQAKSQPAASETAEELVETGGRQFPPPGKRHDIGYRSRSKTRGTAEPKEVPIEEMNAMHLRNAINKRAREIRGVPRSKAPVAHAEYDALVNELKFRMQSGFEHRAF